jgi:DNA-binding SARP family transcriptional activator
MPKPSIKLLGRFEIMSGRGRPCRFETARSRDLMISLLLEPRRAFTRDELAERLWPERDPANSRRALNTEMWRLRKSLSAAGFESESWFCGGAGIIGLQLPEEVEVDLHRFLSLVARLRGRSPEDTGGDLAILHEIEMIYGGDLLSGLHCEWCLLWRETVRNAFVETMERLMESFRRARDWQRVLYCARRILSEDPLLEHIHREVIHCLVALGDRPSAVRHYADFRVRLQTELDCEPMPETVAVYEALLGTPIAPAAAEAAPATREGIGAQLGEAIGALRRTANALEQIRCALSNDGPRQAERKVRL